MPISAVLVGIAVVEQVDLEAAVPCESYGRAGLAVNRDAHWFLFPFLYGHIQYNWPIIT